MKWFGCLILTVSMFLPVSLSGQNSHKKTIKAQRECDPPTGVMIWDIAGVSNGVPYKCSSDGKWVINKEAVVDQEKEQKHKYDLYWALRSRVLTSDEMKEVEQYGIYLIVTPMTPFDESEKNREFNDALLQQFRLRLAAEAVKTKTGCGK